MNKKHSPTHFVYVSADSFLLKVGRKGKEQLNLNVLDTWINKGQLQINEVV